MIAVADGAGGTGGGAQAAQAVIDAVRAAGRPSWDVVLEALDARGLGGGETTAIALTVIGGDIVGACVGDSGAWVIAGGEIEELTLGARRKPLLGSGAAEVFNFYGALPDSATLLVASDGLLKYAPRTAIVRAAALRSLEHAADALVDAARLPGGGLQDDLAVVLYRR